MKTWKKVLALVLAVSMVIPGVYLGGSGSKEVQASEGDTVSTVTAKDRTKTWSREVAEEYLNTKKENRTIPVYEDEEGFVFAGLFNREECTLDDGIANIDDIEGETVWLKFVPVGILDVKAQSTPSGSGDIMRFVSSVDTLNYSKVGFEVTYKVEVESDGDEPTYKNVTKTNISNTVYKKIDSTNENIKYEFDPKVVDVESDYFITATLDINSAPFDKNVGTDYTVKAFWETFDGVRVRGASRCVSVADCRATNTVNLTFTAAGITTDTKLSVKECSTDKVIPGEVTVVAVDGNTVHVRITLKNKAANDQTSSKAKLPSATKFTFMVTPEEGAEAGPAVGSAIFRNLYTKYTGPETDDITWYDVYGEKAGEYIIATSADLYGLATLVNAPTYDFNGQMIYIVSDITVNEGSATASGWSTADPISWTPIGNYAATRAFEGTLNGGGHTISGLYTKTPSTNGVGLFACTNSNSKATIGNFRIVNSYFQGLKGAGSVIGWGKGGNVYSVYSEAVVDSASPNAEGYAGGIVGLQQGAGKIENCWNAGPVHATYRYAGGIGGLVGAGVVINNCLNSGAISASYATEGDAGGLIGVCTGGMTIKNSLHAGTTSIPGSNHEGGVIAHINGGLQLEAFTIENVYYIAKSGRAAVGYYKPESTVQTNKDVGDSASVAGQDLIELGVPALHDNDEWCWEEGLRYPVLTEFEKEVERELLPHTNWYNKAEEGVGETEDNPYLIKNAMELYGLAALVDGGNTFANKFIKLANDITDNEGNAADWSENAPVNVWNPIGHYDVTSANARAFAGTFDGDGHTISGLYTSETKNQIRVGLFANTDSASTIKNFRIVNSYFEGGWGAGVSGRGGGNFSSIYSEAIVKSAENYAGGIIGQIQAATTIENCWNAGSVSGPGRYVGGIAGLASGATVIKNCLNSGAIVGGKANGNEGDVGGLIGVCTAGMTIRNSLHVGTTVNSPTPTTNHEGGVIGHINGGTKLEEFTVENVYYIAKNGRKAVGYCNPTSNASQNNQDIGTGTSSVTEDDLLYNGIPALQNTDEWFWEEGLRYPVLTGFEEGIDRIIVPHTSWYDNAGLDVGTTADDPYLIKDAADLYGLAKIVNSGEQTFKDKYIKLTGNITMNEGNATDWAEKTPLNLWTPIGIYNGVAFEGNFDGDGHTISGVCAKLPSTTSVALFGATTTDTTIGNFRVVNSYFEGFRGVGTVGGWITSVNKVYSIYTDAIIHSVQAANDTGYSGGILGLITGTGTIENCWNAGPIHAVTRYSGGITGYAGKGVVIDNCLNSGALTADTGEGDAGGLVGQCISGMTIKNSLHVGTANTYHQGGVTAHILGGVSIEDFTIENVYYIEKANRSAIGYYNGPELSEAAYDMKVDGATAVSAADLASKGVAGLQDTDAWHWEAGYKYPVLSIFTDIMKK